MRVLCNAWPHDYGMDALACGRDSLRGTALRGHIRRFSSCIYIYLPNIFSLILSARMVYLNIRLLDPRATVKCPIGNELIMINASECQCGKELARLFELFPVAHRAAALVSLKMRCCGDERCYF